MSRISQLKAALLDTHVWVWSAAGDPRANALREFRGTACVSAISVWEVAMLAAKGRLDLRPTPDDWVRENLRAPVELEPLHPDVAMTSSRLENFHGDPADRMIVATAIVCSLPLFTSDQRIVQWADQTKRITVFAPDEDSPAERP
jgi:PIN domain nuclease of toxin-antitoxin system